MLKGGQSKQAVIKHRISAMTAVFMVLLQRTQPFPHPLLSIPKANFHTSAGLLHCCKGAQSHCVCVFEYVCVRMCVLLKPSASLRPIRKKEQRNQLKPNLKATTGLTQKAVSEINMWVTTIVLLYYHVNIFKFQGQK